MKKQETIDRVKELNSVLLGLGFSEDKILKFWDKCKRETQKNSQLKLLFP